MSGLDSVMVVVSSRGLPRWEDSSSADGRISPARDAFAPVP